MKVSYLNKLLILSLILVTVGFIPISHAATGVPSVLSYQGRLTNSSGDLVGGSGTVYYFKFSIWDVSTGGVAGTNRLWPALGPTAATSTVRQGVFNVNIGDTVNGYPDTLDYNFNTNQNIYLQIEVSTNGVSYETLSPRQRISSAPFAQVAAAVNGVGQSSFGTTTPISNAVVSIVSTTTTSIPLLVRSAVGQLASLLRFEDSSLNHLFSVDSLGGIFGSSTLTIGTSNASTSLIVNSFGKVGVGTNAPTRRFNVLDVNTSPQLRVSQSDSSYGEVYVDPAGDVQISSTGGNVRQADENLWVCSGGSCGVDTPVDKGNIIVETSVIFNNKFKFKQTDASTTVMYDSIGDSILEFDEGQ